MNSSLGGAFGRNIKIHYTPVAANRHLSLLSRMLKLAVLWGFIEKNPAVGSRKAQENNERHRYLADEEIARFIEALRTDPNTVAAAFFEFLLYTRPQGRSLGGKMGARRSGEADLVPAEDQERQGPPRHPQRPGHRTVAETAPASGQCLSVPGQGGRPAAEQSAEVFQTDLAEGGDQRFPDSRPQA